MEKIMRLPAFPLITNDPYFSLWCASDLLTDCDVTHWAGSVKRVRGTAVIDGECYRFLGLGEGEAMSTVSLKVTATSTESVFEKNGVKLTLKFTSALLLDDLDIMSAPVTFADVTAESLDGKTHKVAVSLRAYDDICYDGKVKPEMMADQYVMGGLNVAYTGQTQQKLLCNSGDHITIDWGYLYVASRAEVKHTDDYIAVSAKAEVSANAALSMRALIGYDDVASIDYFGVPTKAWCFRNGKTMAALLREFDEKGDEILARAAKFDEELYAESEKRGGEDYALITAAAYRHAIAAHKLIADENGEVVLLSKENDSNGCIGTVDVSYPSSPLFLKYNPELVRGLCRPVLRFAMTDAWEFDFAPHDVGRYPHAIGQVYGLKRHRAENGEVYPEFFQYPAGADIYEFRYQMPVEECGNMLVMMHAAEKADGNMALTKKYLPLLTKWAGYLLEYGEDPGEQLCTDDFAGHLARNINLAAKALVGVKCFAEALKTLGDARYAEYEEKGKKLAESWIARAGKDGNTPLTFAGEGWSMKYNLAWDKVLGLGIFSAIFYAAETASYVPRINAYGLPLDSRRDYTKSDWILWTAAMAEDAEVFQKIVAPVARYLRETTTRVAFSDWYDTKTGKYEHFIARSVQGGLFMPLL